MVVRKSSVHNRPLSCFFRWVVFKYSLHSPWSSSTVRNANSWSPLYYWIKKTQVLWHNNQLWTSHLMNPVIHTQFENDCSRWSFVQVLCNLCREDKSMMASSIGTILFHDESFWNCTALSIIYYLWKVKNLTSEFLWWIKTIVTF